MSTETSAMIEIEFRNYRKNSKHSDVLSSCVIWTAGIRILSCELCIDVKKDSRYLDMKIVDWSHARWVFRIGKNTVIERCGVFVEHRTLEYAWRIQLGIHKNLEKEVFECIKKNVHWNLRWGGGQHGWGSPHSVRFATIRVFRPMIQLGLVGSKHSRIGSQRYQSFHRVLRGYNGLTVDFYWRVIFLWFGPFCDDGTIENHNGTLKSGKGDQLSDPKDC